ncbi:MAG: type II toxin-antitoxin system VapC family toxin, partial [Gemmataceae bacterium]
MILLDTDHVTLIKFPDSERARRLLDRLDQRPTGEVVAVSIITVEEQMRGWLASIAKERHAARQVSSYRELGQLFEY